MPHRLTRRSKVLIALGAGLLVYWLFFRKAAAAGLSGSLLVDADATKVNSQSANPTVVGRAQAAGVGKPVAPTAPTRAEDAGPGWTGGFGTGEQDAMNSLSPADLDQEQSNNTTNIGGR